MVEATVASSNARSLVAPGPALPALSSPEPGSCPARVKAAVTVSRPSDPHLRAPESRRGRSYQATQARMIKIAELLSDSQPLNQRRRRRSSDVGATVALPVSTTRPQLQRPEVYSSGPKAHFLLVPRLARGSIPMGPRSPASIGAQTESRCNALQVSTTATAN
eukprot:332581-Rhodomonas_salina.6